MRRVSDSFARLLGPGHNVTELGRLFLMRSHAFCRYTATIAHPKDETGRLRGSPTIRHFSAAASLPCMCS